MNSAQPRCSVLAPLTPPRIDQLGNSSDPAMSAAASPGSVLLGVVQICDLLSRTSWCGQDQKCPLLSLASQVSTEGPGQTWAAVVSKAPQILCIQNHGPRAQKGYTLVSNKGWLSLWLWPVCSFIDWHSICPGMDYQEGSLCQYRSGAVVGKENVTLDRRDKKWPAPLLEGLSLCIFRSEQTADMMCLS